MYYQQSYRSDDGDYYRPVGFRPGITNGVRWLLIANVVCFIVQQIIGIAFRTEVLFGLVPELVIKLGFVWQPVTYMFLHGGVFHLLWNMLALWVFGCDVERRWGTRRFVRFYLLGGLSAAACTLVVALMNEQMAVSPTIGASGAVLAVLAAYAIMFPDNRITLLFMLVLPITMKAKTLAIGYTVITVLIILSTPVGSDGVAHFAHLGGLAFGYLYVKHGDSFEMALRRRRARRSEQRLWARAEQREETEKFMREEVDPILDKISRQGVESLTRRERAILRRAQKTVRQ